MAETRNERTNSAPPPRGGGGGGRGRGPAPLPKITKENIKSLKRVLAYLGKRYKWRFILVLICIVINAITSTAGTLFLQTLIDDYIKPLLLDAAPNFTPLMNAILKMAGIYAIGIGAALCQSLTMIIISQGIIKQIRDDMFENMQHLPISYFDTNTHGNIMSHFTNDTDTLRQLLGNSIPSLCATAITVIVVLISMISLSPLLTLFVVILVVGIFFFSVKIAGKSAGHFIQQQRSLGALNGFVEEIINGQKVVKVFCHEEQAKEDFDGLNESLCENATGANTFANILMPILGSLGNVMYVIIAVSGAAMAISGIGSLTLGTIVSFLTLSRNFNQQVNQVSQQLNSVISALAGADRIFTLMDEKPESDDGVVTLVNASVSDGKIEESSSPTGKWAWKIPDGIGYRYVQVLGDVRFADVDFSYVPDKQILYDISLFAKPGQKLAFVGATGAGKTTITNLINRFYDISDGVITYDGIDIKSIKKDDLRRSLGIVLQDVNLFTGSVMDNIRYGKLDATDEECIAAAKLANAHGFISRLPDGYDTILTGDGSGLSQGQRQLISIARAAVSNPPVMILDEATSSIDTRTESLVQRGMDSLMNGRTVFVIAHRLSTVQNSNAIIVLELGHIIERGDHDQLIDMKGKYYQLYTGAFELE